ncbi:sarcoplasmic calcium-binding protein-like [Lingula anatina]|uniref:Sarcoplasmic calcium-binding protein-like n=1 Tax=Lingula anatina TaxID=7574 RepID=A0A1S3HKM7_LINAN|nr:sarcoplasmic calcium-binding protein-like [Lingula anatina]|eukprot:XP_013386653.1 sarcoplasmic calcium-binding protein-like [Lingula anatina]
MARMIFSKRLIQGMFSRSFTHKAVSLKMTPHDYPPITGSEHWKRKLRTLFRARDADKDGFLTKKDFEMCAHRVSSYMELNESMAREVLRKRQYTWEKLSCGTSDPDNLKLSEDEFLHQLHRYTRDAALGLACNDFDSIDIDGDGFISPKEHKAFFYGNGIPTDKSGMSSKCLIQTAMA